MRPYDDWTNGGYYGSDSPAEPQQVAMLPPEFVPPPYEVNPFAGGLATWAVDVPYYDTDPVEFSYTPADAPQQATVARRPLPEQDTTSARILNLTQRRPLYKLVVQMPPLDLKLASDRTDPPQTNDVAGQPTL